MHEAFLVRYFKFLETKGKTFNIIIGIACTVLIGTVDALAPDSATFSFLYLLPIGFVTWFGENRAGFLISLFCSALWSHDKLAHMSIITAWNILSTFAIFCTFSIMISKMKGLLENEKSLSRKDPLTGAMNLRAFNELMEYELFRLKREGSPYSIAYLDLDDFKMVNDRFGHKKGDELLKAVISNLVENLRKTDVVARIGGDEFAVFLPATDHTTVRVVMDKVREHLHERSERDQFFTSLSIGVLTCTDGECEFEEIISAADRLMYEVKNSGKNNIRYSTLSR
jgi:diguanylate cyclase (GGDEF)-like protein